MTGFADSLDLVPEPNDEFWGQFPDQERYTEGQCHALAIALVHFRPEWQLVYMCPPEIGGHAVAVLPDGRILDILGLRRPRVCDNLELRPGEDPFHNWDRPVLDEHTLTVAAKLLRRRGL